MSRKNHSQRLEDAKKHLALVRGVFATDVARSIEATRHYEDGEALDAELPEPRYDETITRIADEDTVSGIIELQHKGEKTAALDFASFMNPGGGYANGAWAQEEALCAESTLFPILDARYDDFYRPHRSYARGGLYTSSALYVPDVVFMRDGKMYPGDVIVVAAPNARSARENNRSEREIENDLRRRCTTVLSIAALNEVDRLVLGAFGCGVFANDPVVAADAFCGWLDEHPGAFKEVLFAIPKGKDGRNYDAFAERIGGTGF